MLVLNKQIFHQNCDATGRESYKLAKHVPSSQTSQLFLQAIVWVRVPYKNNKFGPPKKSVRSLWAGLITFRRWCNTSL